MKNSFSILIILSTLVAALLHNTNNSEAKSPEFTNYQYNTVFAGSPYSEENFQNIKVGSSKDSVLEILGEPLYTDQIEYLHCLLFAEEGYRIDPLAAKYHGINSSKVLNHGAPFLAVWFSEKGKINHIFNHNYIDKEQEQKLIGQNRETVISQFGQPKEELNIEPSYFFSYSKLIDGPYTGHDQGIFIRRVYFNKHDKVISVESGQGPMHEIYSGIISKNKK